MHARRLRARHIGIASMALIAVAWGFYWYVRTPRATDETAGYALADKLGCHGCHGPRGVGGTPNPGSKETEIPSWDGGTPMMYAESEAELREWILDGVPRRIAAGREASGDSDGHDREHHAATEANAPPVRMPAYRHVIDEDQVDLLVSYVKAVALWEPISEAALRGRRAAARLGCFGCHGPGGMIGVANPMSFKGYIPPWRGKDFAELVRDEEELRSWILDGGIARFESNPIARMFTRRQVIQMPAYRSVVSGEELDDIVTYIQELSRESK